MNILSIFPGHNSAICILRDGEVLLNWELERFTRIKHDYGFRHDFLIESLNLCDLTIDAIDLIATNRGLESGTFREGTVLRPFDVPATTMQTVVPFEVDIMGVKREALAINHHLAHAACAFFTSPFDEAILLTYDGYGDAENSSLGLGRGNKIECFERTQFADLPGWWVSVTLNNYRMPRVHEWDPGSHCGKIMALAAYGDSDPQMRQDLERDISEGLRQPHYLEPHMYAFNNSEDLSDTRYPRSQLLSRSLQDKTDEVVAHYFRFAGERYPDVPHICYAGGFALNCIANSRALQASGFDRLHVPPCPNDSGLALGMAMYMHYHHLGNSRQPTHFLPFTGPIHREASATFPELARQHGLTVVKMTNEHLVDILCQRELICFYGPRSECGPRALGARSILCLPDRDNCRDFLNFHVKRREWYRPYAPMILAEMAQEVLENFSLDSAYMTTSATIRHEWRARLAGVNHIDNTTRPQIVTEHQYPFWHEVLLAIYRRTGIPALLNTSFNLQEPIVETPFGTWQTFLAMPVPYLVTEDYIIAKRVPPLGVTTI